MLSPENTENSLSPQAFAKYYDGRPLDEVAAELEDQLLARPGWKVDGNVFPQVWQKIFGWIIPLMPIEGKAGKEAREFLARKEDKYGRVLPVIARLPAGNGCRWESGYIRLPDLDRSADELLDEVETAVTNLLDKRKKIEDKEKLDQLALTSMLILAFIAKTSPEELNNSALVKILTDLSKVI